MSVKINPILPKHQPTAKYQPTNNKKTIDATKQKEQAIKNLAIRFSGGEEIKTPPKKTVDDFYQKVLQEQPLSEADRAKKLKIPLNLSKNASLEDYRSAFDKAILQKAGYSMLNKSEVETARGLMGLKDNFSLENLKDLDKSNKLFVKTNQRIIEKAKIAGQAVLQFKDYEAKLKDANNAKGENETNQILIDHGKVLWNSLVNNVEGGINTGIDAVNSKGGQNPLVLMNPNRPRIDLSSLKADYRSEMMRTDVNGKLDGNGIKRGDFTEGAVTILGPLVVGKVSSPFKAPNTLKSLGALPEVERTVLIPKTAQEIVEKRYDEISNKGHTVQRHGAEVTEKQLDARAIEGKDPITGTTKDAFRKDAKGNPLPHLTNKNATKFISKESLVKAEKYVKNTQEYKNALANIGNDKVFAIEDVKLQDVFGSDYKKQVFGKTRIGSRNNPTGAILTDFTDGTIRAVFKKDSNGAWHIFTMFAEPKK
jgi:hypothetical protein